MSLDTYKSKPSNTIKFSEAIQELVERRDEPGLREIEKIVRRIKYDSLDMMDFQGYTSPREEKIRAAEVELRMVEQAIEMIGKIPSRDTEKQRNLH